MKPSTTSINEVIGRVKRHSMLETMPEEAIIEYTVDFMRILDIPDLFQEKVAVVNIENYRGVLPQDFLRMTQVRTYCEAGTDTQPIYYRKAGDTFHLSEKKSISQLTYKLQGKVIYTSNKSGDIEISYLAMELDECGLPVVPDNAKFLRAVVAYIKLEKFQDYFDKGDINQQVLAKAEQDYYFAVGACETEFKMPDIDEAESMVNMANSLFPRTSQHQRGYANMGDMEFIRVH